MSTRTRISPFPVIINGNMASSLTSAVTVLQSVSGYSYQVSWSGSSPVGTLSVQGSNNYSLSPNGSVENSGTWDTIYVTVNGGAPAATIAVSGNTGHGLIEILKTTVYAVRLIYTAGDTPGTGTLNAVINGRVS